MKKVTFIGTPGSGKTTLATQVFTTLKKKGINAELVPEWVRSDLHLNGPMQSVWEQYRTRNYHKEIEDAVPKQVNIMVSDSSTLTPYFYAVHYLNPKNPRERLVLQDMYRYLLDDIYLERYDLIFYLPIPSEDISTDDGTRFQSREDIEILDMHMGMIFTTLHKTDNIHCIDGPLDSRHDTVMKIINELIEKDIATETTKTYNDDVQKR